MNTIPKTRPHTVRLGKEAAKIARKGHPWFFRDDFAVEREDEVATAADPVAPENQSAIVRVRDEGGRDMGLGFWDIRSRLALRLSGPWEGHDVPARTEFFAKRLQRAAARRRTLSPDCGAPDTNTPLFGQGASGKLSAGRFVHGEADGLPGLVIDLFGEVAVVQSTSNLVERSLDVIVPWLVENLGVTSVVARHDLPIRGRAGLPEEVRVLHGKSVPAIAFDEDGIVHQARPMDGHKTGYYLDQRPARAAVRAAAKGRKGLDVFAYQGGFALSALAGGATSMLAIDQSQPALDLAMSGAADNGLSGMKIEQGNGFDVLRTLRDSGEMFDLIVVDPPAFAKSRREVEGALRGYRDLNRIAMRLLAPGGLLFTFTCSHHVDRETFETLLRQAAAGLPFRALLRERLGAGPDHPIWFGLPESEYLKGCVVERADL